MFFRATTLCVHPHTTRLSRLLLTQRREFGSKLILPVLDPDLKKPPVDLSKHDPHGKFSPAVHEFIRARDFENCGGRKLDVVSFDWCDYRGTVEVNDFVFAANPRIDILHRNVVWYRACIRAGTACVKRRDEVRGGAKKPFRQKGSGRARRGSKVDVTQRGGGSTKGPRPRDYSYWLPYKVRRMGLRVALSCKLAQGDLVVVEDFDALPHTADDLQELLEQNSWDNALLVDAYENERMYEMTRELNASEVNPRVHATHSTHLHVYGILARHKLVLSLDALRVLDEKLSDDGRVVTEQKYRLLCEDVFDPALLDGEYDAKRDMVIPNGTIIQPPKTRDKQEQRARKKPKPKKWSKTVPLLEPYTDGQAPLDAPKPSTSIRGKNALTGEEVRVLRYRLKGGTVVDSS